MFRERLAVSTVVLIGSCAIGFVAEVLRYPSQLVLAWVIGALAMAVVIGVLLGALGATVVSVLASLLKKRVSPTRQRLLSEGVALIVSLVLIVPIFMWSLIAGGAVAVGCLIAGWMRLRFVVEPAGGIVPQSDHARKSEV